MQSKHSPLSINPKGGDGDSRNRKKLSCIKRAELATFTMATIPDEEDEEQEVNIWRKKKRRNIQDLKLSVISGFNFQNNLHAMKKLTQLTLSWQRPSISEFEEILSGLKYLPLLDTLSICIISPRRSDRYAEILSVSLQGCKRLSKLSLEFRTCHMTEKGIISLSNSLKRFRLLNSFCLKFDRCGFIFGRGPSCLFSNMRRLCNLQSLHIQFTRTKIYENYLPSLHQTLKHLRLLQDLSIHYDNSSCHFDDTEAESLVSSFINLKDLKSLYLGFGMHLPLSSKGERALWKGIQCLNKLTSLAFHVDPFYRFTDFHMESLTQTLIGLKFLKNFSLSASLDSEQVFETLADALKTKRNLRELSLCLSVLFLITTPKMKTLITSLRCLKSLEMIQLKFDQMSRFSKEGLKQLFEGLKELESIRVLDLSFDTFLELSGKELEKLCINLKSLPRLGEFTMKTTQEGFDQNFLQNLSSELKNVKVFLT